MNRASDNNDHSDHSATVFFQPRQISDCMEIFSFNIILLYGFSIHICQNYQNCLQHGIENMKGLAKSKIFHQGLLSEKSGDFRNKKIF